jgi:hypothetical protein
VNGFDDEPRGVLEDAVVRHKRQLEPDRGGGDPAISVVLSLAEAWPIRSQATRSWA